MLFVGTSIIHPSTEGVFLLCNILDLLIYSKEDDVVEIEYDYTLIQKMLLKYAYNDMRSRKEDCSFFDEEILEYLMDINNNVPKDNITVMCGLAVNVSPVPDSMFGNMKLRWCKSPFLYSNSTIRHIDYNTGEVFLNEDIKKEEFPDLRLSYAFRFNSVQLLLFCWDKESTSIEQNNICLLYTSDAADD